MRFEKKILMGPSLALAMATLSSAAMAETYQASTWLGMTSDVTTEGFLKFSENLKKATGGEIEFETHVGGVLLPAKETLQGVGQGVAALGQITAAYVPADLPLNNVLGDMGFTSTDSFVSPFALADVRINNASARQEWEKHNIVYGASFSTSTYHFHCMKPLRTLADAKGLKIRASVGAQVDFLKSIDAIPVSVPGSDIYSGLERGSVDCALMADESLVGLKLIEVVRYATKLPMGAFYGGATWGFNRDFWRGLSEKNRRLVLDEVAAALVRVQMGLAAGDQRAREESVSKYKMEWFEASPDMYTALNAFLEDFVAQLPAKSMEKRNVADPSGLINDYIAAKAKWVKLLEGVDRSDEAALTAIVKREIYDKIDVKTYGM